MCTDPNCYACTETICKSCKDNYYLINNKCVPCDKACAGKCSGAGSKACEACADGYIPDAVLGCKSCETFFVGCLKCSNGVCTACLPGFYWYND